MVKIIEEQPDANKKTISAVATIIGVLLVAGILLGAFYTVNAGERGVLLTWGQANTNAIEPGLHFKIPFVQQVVKMEVRTQKYEAEATAASQDLQTVTAKIATNYHITPSMAPKIYVDLGKDYAERIIQPVEQEAVKATTATFTAEQLITKREEVRLEIKKVLTDRLAERNIIVEEVSIIDFDFSDSFNQAIEAKVTAEQLKLKAENDLQRIKVEAEQAIAQAKGQAGAIKAVQEELARSPTYIEYLKVTKWNGQLPTVTSGMPFIDVTPK